VRGCGNARTRHRHLSARFSTTFSRESSGFRISRNARRPTMFSSNPTSITDAVRSPGICVFIDGSNHAGYKAQDRTAREAFEDRGYRIVAITSDRPLTEQIEACPEIIIPMASGSWGGIADRHVI